MQYYKANGGGTPVAYPFLNWLLYIRQMQQNWRGIRINRHNNGNLTSGNTNLDIHMRKKYRIWSNAILSASSYGMGSTPIKSGETTTGNATGIRIMINSEWVSALRSDLRKS